MTSVYEDEAGMPKHLPMPVTEDGEGPASPDETHHYVCWCGDAKCWWTEAFHHNFELGRADAGG